MTPRRTASPILLALAAAALAGVASAEEAAAVEAPPLTPSPGATDVAAAMETVRSEKDPQRRVKAVVALGKAKDPAAIPVLVDALRPGPDPQKDWFVRKEATLALVSIGAPSIEPLKQALHDDSSIVRARALAGLTKLRAPGVFDILAAHLREDGSEQVRLEAVFQLRELGDPGSAAAIRAASQTDRSPALRERAAKIADQIEDAAR